ncbi:hypothetical protein SLEP1_g10915 [Rubroshorea leprosula]|uniref:Uncharacterized protein n=1 Tax=Rubroshorea leprosula TaxID=152421 RepID=A0AAV5IJ28_9ROSI|nr:hypothetical protein SLEP1_g10915 [Rubroshorea leprosula]
MLCSSPPAAPACGGRIAWVLAREFLHCTPAGLPQSASSSSLLVNSGMWQP